MQPDIASIGIIEKSNLVLIHCAFIVLATSILPVYAGDDLAQPMLRGLPIAESTEPIEMDSASTASAEQKPAQPVNTIESEEPMQTIDSQSVKPVESQGSNESIEPQSTKAIEPEAPTQNIQPESITPVEPETPTKNIEPEETSQAAEPKAAKKDIGAEAAHFIEQLPQRAGLFTAGVVVGAPATFARRSVQYTASFTRELIGDTGNPILVVPAGALSLPYALMSGLAEGTVFGVTNSWKHSADGHLTKASLGLEDEK